MIDDITVLRVGYVFHPALDAETDSAGIVRDRVRARAREIQREIEANVLLRKGHFHAPDPLPKFTDLDHGLGPLLFPELSSRGDIRRGAGVRLGGRHIRATTRWCGHESPVVARANGPPAGVAHRMPSASDTRELGGRRLHRPSGAEVVEIRGPGSPSTRRVEQ